MGMLKASPTPYFWAVREGHHGDVKPVLRSGEVYNAATVLEPKRRARAAYIVMEVVR